MAILNFPANPSVNDTYEENNVIYVWDGAKWTANSNSNLNDVFVNVNGDTMTGDLTVPSLNGGPLAGMRNQLINGDFRIWQRGTSIDITSASEYHVDRWKCNTTTNVTIERRNSPVPGQTYAVLLPAGSGRLVQAVELNRQGSSGPFMNGSTWTLSFWCTAADLTSQTLLARFVDTAGGSTNVVEVVSRNFTADERKEQTTSATVFYKYECTFDIAVSPNATNLAFEISLPGGNATGGEIRYSGCQLEPGPVATLFEMRPIGLELSLCQRYFFKTDQPIVSASYHNNSSNLSNGSAIVFHPTEMRIVPNVDNVSYMDANQLSNPRSTSKCTTFFLTSTTSEGGRGSGVSSGVTFNAEL